MSEIFKIPTAPQLLQLLKAVKGCNRVRLGTMWVEISAGPSRFSVPNIHAAWDSFKSVEVTLYTSDLNVINGVTLNPLTCPMLEPMLDWEDIGWLKQPRGKFRGGFVTWENLEEVLEALITVEYLLAFFDGEVIAPEAFDRDYLGKSLAQYIEEEIEVTL